MLTITHEGQTIEINPDSLIIIENATIEQYEQFANEDLKLDFDGVRLYIHSPATKEHEKLMFKLYALLNDFFTDHPDQGEVLGGHFSIHLPNGERTEPDLLVIPPNTVPPKDYEFAGVPLFIIEILSPTPSVRYHDLHNKKQWYISNSVPEFWFVNPEGGEIITYHLLETGAYDEKVVRRGKVTSQYYEGLSFHLPALFEI